MESRCNSYAINYVYLHIDVLHPLLTILISHALLVVLSFFSSSQRGFSFLKGQKRNKKPLCKLLTARPTHNPPTRPLIAQPAHHLHPARLGLVHDSIDKFIMHWVLFFVKKAVLPSFLRFDNHYWLSPKAHSVIICRLKYPYRFTPKPIGLQSV